LLGHNGAGKSTTINLLTGLLKPTSGDIQILGMDFKMNKEEIRRSMGLCLQFNVLYENLTIEEHLTFYALLKGI
jgi:ABC-type multidrug transport system ATPase subunit